MSVEANLALVEHVAELLEGLDLVFVGGAVLFLYLPETLRGSVRATNDVDCVVSVTSYGQFHEVGRALTQRGFTQSNNKPQDPLCRWRTPAGIVVDMMPTDEGILGFSNQWYKLGVQMATVTLLPSGRRIRVFTLALYMASKAEAFNGRGRADPLASADFEDLVTLLDARDDVMAEIQQAPDAVQRYLMAFFLERLADPYNSELVSGHAPRPDPTHARARVVLERMWSLSRILT